MRKRDLKTIYPYIKESNAFIIDLQLDKYNDVYSEWDFSPIFNRDLNEDLTQYLMECANEIPLKYKIVVRFFILNQEVDNLREAKSTLSFRNYFTYQLRKVKNKRLEVLGDILKSLLLGVGLLVLSSYVSQNSNMPSFGSILEQGLLIGGWVMIWEMFSATFFRMSRINRRLRLIDRLVKSEVQYETGRRNLS